MQQLSAVRQEIAAERRNQAEERRQMAEERTQHVLLVRTQVERAGELEQQSSLP